MYKLILKYNHVSTSTIIIHFLCDIIIFDINLSKLGTPGYLKMVTNAIPFCVNATCTLLWKRSWKSIEVWTISIWWSLRESLLLLKKYKCKCKCTRCRSSSGQASSVDCKYYTLAIGSLHSLANNSMVQSNRPENNSSGQCVVRDKPWTGPHPTLTSQPRILTQDILAKTAQNRPLYPVG